MPWNDANDLSQSLDLHLNIIVSQMAGLQFFSGFAVFSEFAVFSGFAVFSEFAVVCGI